ncbi:MAG: hypothetical protein HC896_03900 [Bacteroidales bacterium]|nr:hypothetical protein [Bacteroidales bacterium]
MAGKRPDSTDVNLNKQVEKLNNLYASSKTVSDQGLKETYYDSVFFIFANALETKASFAFGFDSLKYMGHLTSQDNFLRVHSWNMPKSDGTHKYYCIVQVNQKKNYRIYSFTSTLGRQENIERKKVPYNQWYGALYYDIIKTKHQGQEFYTLLGLDLNDLYSNKKYIDIITVPDDYEPHFGEPVFNDGATVRPRVIFEYSSRAQMTLRYEEKLKMIVFDHLVPIAEQYTGDPRFNVPDNAKNGYKWENGSWVLHKDVDISN